MAQGYVAPPINVWSGRVTQIIDPHYFFMHFGTSELLQQFELLQQEIQVFCENNWTCVRDTDDQLDYGQVVLVDSGTKDGTRYKRGQITRHTGENIVDVFYVDYGLTEVKGTECICTSYPQDFRKWPPQAVRCILAGVLPISRNWTSRATKFFQRITEGKLFKTLVLYGEPGFCEVSLYQSDSENGRSISHEMLDEDVAMPDESKEIPEYFSQIMDFLRAIMPQDLMLSSNGNTESRQPETQPPSSTSTPPAPSKPTDRYVPPQRKQHDFSLNTSFVPSSSSGSRSSKSSAHDARSGSSATSAVSPKSSSALKHSPKGLHLNTALDKNKPVNDFFPFNNVSTYPATPTSPMKSPSKPSDNTHSPQNIGSGSEGSYFSRSPMKQDNVNMSASPHQHHQHYSSPSKPDVGGYSGSYNGTYSDHIEHKHRHHDHRFAANLNKLPSPGRQEPMKSPKSPGSSLLDGQNAAANLEPSYLNNAISDRQGSQRSPKAQTDGHTHGREQSDYRYSADGRSMPFYPPASQHTQQHGDPTRSPVSASHTQHYNKPGQAPLVPPGFFTSSPNQKHPADTAGDSNRHSQTAGYNDSYNNYGSNSVFSSPKKDQYDQYYQHSNTGAYSPQSNNYGNQYSRNTGNYSPNKYTKTSEHVDEARSPKSNVNNSNYTSQSPHQLKLRLPETPTKPASMSEKRGKMSPATPDSADIAEFNIGDLDHSQHTSAAYFHERVYQEKLQALQEEAETIAAESKEQSKLVQMARYGAGQDEPTEVNLGEEPTDIFQQIAEEINASNTHPKKFDELKRSPIKKKNKNVDEGPYIPPKLESIPANYLVDIDFTEAVKEALEFSQNDSLENAKILMDGIVESMKSANVEKQVYDVLMLMLAKAIKDYNQFHTLILDAINNLNVEMEIKECLSRALKRQQELCIRLRAHDNACHVNCSRIMGHVFVMTHDWADSNANVQDVILASVEKWILFNSKGSQIGQTEKEILFLECFGAFWEVAGVQLMDSNYSFKSRIQTDVRNKLLNENVSRQVREMLLDILLELASQRTDRASVHTQTVKRTLIPSSCQVKPSQVTMGTQTKPVQIDEDEYMIDDYDRKWQFLSSNIDDVTAPESPATHDLSSEQYKSSHRNDSTTELSFHSANADTSTYHTPNASLDTGADFYVNDASGRAENVSAINAKSDTKDTVSARLSEKFTKDNVPVAKSSSRSFSSVIRDKGTKVGSKATTATELKSAKGKSIVDWFDYEPEIEETVNYSKPDKSKDSKASSWSNRSPVETKDKQSKLLDVEVKYPESGQMDGKSVKSRKQKKTKQSSLGDNSVDGSPVKGGESLSVDTQGRGGNKSLVAYFSDLTISDDKSGGGVGDLGDDTADKSGDTGDKSGPDYDWWGREDATNMMDNIYVDTGPDVIIDGEEEVCVTQGEITHPAGVTGEMSLTAADTETNIYDSEGDARNDGRDAIDFRGALSDGLGADVDGATCDVNKSKLMNEYSGDMTQFGADYNVRHNTGNFTTDIIRPAGAEKLDDFAFDTDSDGDPFNDDDDDENNDFFGAMNYEEDFPKSDLKKKITPTVPDVEGATSSYDTDFPKSNLRDYLRPVQEFEPPSQPKQRWVPRKRICLNCHDESHTTENCPKGFLLLQ